MNAEPTQNIQNVGKSFYRPASWCPQSIKHSSNAWTLTLSYPPKQGRLLGVSRISIVPNSRTGPNWILNKWFLANNATMPKSVPSSFQTWQCPLHMLLPPHTSHPKELEEHSRRQSGLACNDMIRGWPNQSRNILESPGKDSCFMGECWTRGCCTWRSCAILLKLDRCPAY